MFFNDSVHNVRAIVVILLISGVTATAGRTLSHPAKAAPEGAIVHVVINTIKSDKKQQFEDAVQKVFAALRFAATKDPIAKRVNDQTRVLSPTKANDDGTYTYVFILDPVVEGGEYMALNILLKALPQAEAERVNDQMSECHAMPQKVIELRETKP
jgi:hypothetical protein